MKSLSDFNELYEFFDKLRVNRIAELNKEPIGFKTRIEYLNEEMKAYVESFLDTMNRLLTNVELYSQNKGPIVLEWLDLVEQLLSDSEGILKTGLENAVRDDDEDVARALRFSVHSLLTMVKMAKRELRKNRGTLRKRHSLALEVRENTLLLLANMFYYFIIMLLTSIRVQNREEEPEQILEVAGEAFYRLSRF